MRLYILLLLTVYINTNIYSQIKPKITTNQISNLLVDSTRLENDSILVYYQNGIVIGRDTISGTGGSVGGVTGSGTTNEIAYFTGATTLGSLATSTYPSLTELSYVKGVTSAIQTQLNGKQATLTNPVTGTGNSIFIGVSAGENDDGTTNQNVGIGYSSMALNTTGSNNTALGYVSLYNLNGGTKNIAIGANAGRFRGSSTGNLTSADNSIFIGVESRASDNGNSNEIVIGNEVIGNGSNSVTIGNNGTLGTATSKIILNGNEVVIGSNAVGQGTNTTVINSTSTVRTTIQGDTLVVSKFLNVDTATLYVDALQNRIGVRINDFSSSPFNLGAFNILSEEGDNKTALNLIRGLPDKINDDGAAYKNILFGRGYSSNPNNIDQNITFGMRQLTNVDSNYANFNFFEAGGGNVGGFGMRYISHNNRVTDFYIATSNGVGSLSTKMTIKGNGDVGIGTTNPTAKLDVNGSMVVDTSTLYVNSDSNRVGIGQTQTLSGAALSLRGGMHFIDPDTTVFEDAVVYIYPKEQTSAGANSGEFGFYLAGPGSTSTTQGPNFLMRGNNYVRNANQRGLISFAAGDVTSPTGNDGIINFVTSSLVRILIAANGNVGIGTTSPTHPLQMGSGAHVTTGGVWTDASDIKLKENINYYFPYGLNEVMHLKPVVFDYKAGEKNTLGFIAQDVQEYIPEAISTTYDINDNLTMGLKMVTITATLTKAIQEQQQIIETQKAEIETLKNQYNDLLQRIINLENK